MRASALLSIALVTGAAATGCNRAGVAAQAPSEVGPPPGPEPEPTPETAEAPPPSTCEDGDGAACLRAAERLAVDAPEAARARLEQGCALEHGPSCTALGAARRRDGDPAALTAAVGALETACRLADPEGCAALAVHLYRGDGVPADPERAGELWKDACDRDVASACRNLGLVHPHASEDDRAAAAEAMRRACALGDGPGCTQLGHFRYAGLGTARDLPGALEAYRAGCDAGFELACDSAENLALEIEDSGGAWARGMVLEKDGARVVVEMQDAKAIPVGETVTIFEWAIRNEVRAWVEVGRVKIRSREGDRVELWVQQFEPDLRTEDYYPLLPKSGVRLQWTGEGARS